MRAHLVAILGLGLLLPVVHGAQEKDSDERLLRAASIATDGPSLLEFFRKRTVEETDARRLTKLIDQLGDDDFPTREKATRQLILVGARARGVLQKAAQSTDPEIRRRARDCLRRIGDREGETTGLIAAAARLLAAHRPAGSSAALLAYLPAAEADGAAEVIRDALTRLAVQEGKADPHLVESLTKGQPIQRATAAEALLRAGATDLRPAIRKLLDDPDLGVRLRVGLALAAERDREAVPSLIALLDQLPLAQTEPIDHFLERLAGERMPILPEQSDDTARRKVRMDWQAWWKDNQGRITPAQVGQAGQPRGLSMVVLLDQGMILDLDRNNRPHWKITGLEFPLDAQLLPGDQKVLVAEHNANRVTERDLEGKVLWKMDVAGPLAAQRLVNGNTFIATREALVEVDRDSKEVYRYTRPDGAAFMRAQKLRNGEIACVVVQQVPVAPQQMMLPHFVRLRRENKELKEVKSFTVDLRTSGGRIDVLANGNVLIPEKDANRVVEVDSEGQVVWKAEVEEPVAAVHTSTGSVVVTSMTQNRAVEVSRNGRDILWDFKSDTRVTRAFRR